MRISEALGNLPENLKRWNDAIKNAKINVKEPLEGVEGS